MEAEDLINELDSLLGYECDKKCSECNGCPIKDTFNEVKRVLEKQIPKKWLYEQGNEDDIYICPICKERFYLNWGTPKDNEYNYCPSCGQALKWEDNA